MATGGFPVRLPAYFPGFLGRATRPARRGRWRKPGGPRPDSTGDVMVIERPTRRMTLRQQLTHAEKCSRDIIEHIHGTFLAYMADLRDLSRPVRRRSHYPTMVAILNALKRVQQTGTETIETLDYFLEQLQEIREHARREKINRR